MTSTRGKIISLWKVGLLFTFSGCASSKYLWQAAAGQADLLWRAKPIHKVLQDPDFYKVKPSHQPLLRAVPAIKAFGELHGLKATRNYEDVVLLDRGAAVYVVSASQKLQFKPRVWSFPVVGSFNYLGWFDVEDAKEHASRLESEGWEVDVRGASAYSTLGWFRDSILSTMLGEGPEAMADLANVVLHESVHATIYISDQSTFNESVASFLGDRLTEIYIEKSPEDLKAWKAVRARSLKWQETMTQASQTLESVYASNRSDGEKLSEKQRLIEALTGNLKSQGYAVRRPINNAVLIQYRTYHTGSEKFEALWKRCGYSSIRFIKAVQSLRPESFDRAQSESFDPVLDRLECVDA